MTEESVAAEDTAGRRRRGALAFLRDLVIIVLVALLVSFLVKTFLVRSFYIPSGSMENTLQIDDRIIVNELVPDVVDLQRGDVVVFTDPGGWLSSPPPAADVPWIVSAWDSLMTAVGLSVSDSNDHLIKRVIGLPGDHVTCCNALGQMSVNGVPLNEPYLLLPQSAQAVSAVSFDVTVPDDSLWVMGDNRYNSKDSRYNGNTPGKGYVPVDNVVGRAFVISWPIDRWQWLSDYPETFDGIPDAGS
ncbi:signal peptidase I [Paramicrobacterium agarici]|uniref:signal peptidase I n=1 Tax=Paramicrobacterium agarici TaxID=630514 RepID=UPI001151E7EC|nr:signal peptidase I [Microbacterium agarici]TQO21408.1 signal peptidase I [Microbacterium agarici]